MWFSFLTEQMLRNEDCSISYNAFGHSSTVFVIDLMTDMTNAMHTEPKNHGGLRAEVRFGDKLPHAVTYFVDAEYNCIEVNKDKKISLDYLI